MKRLLPNLGALVLVAVLVGAVVWLRPDPPPPAPAPVRDVVLQYADGSELWNSGEGRPRSHLERRVLAELADLGLSLDQLRAAGGVVRTTVDAKAQTMAAAVVGRLVAVERGDRAASVTAVEPASGGVRVYLGLSRASDPGGEPAELTPEVVRPFTDAGAPEVVRTMMSPLEVTAAYAALAGGGVRQQPHFVTTVTGADGSQLYRRTGTPEVVVDRQVAERVTAQLKEEPGCGGTSCVTGAHPWTVGYTPQLAVAVFVDQTTGTDLTRVVWQEFLASL